MKKQQRNTLVAAVFIIVIIAALIIYIYVNMPTGIDDDTETPPIVEDEILLTITFEDNTQTYTLAELATLSPVTGPVTFIKMGALQQDPPQIVITNPVSYTGVELSMLWNRSWDLPETYQINITTSDDYPSSYNYSQIMGTVITYNETTGNHSGYITEATLILAYQLDGEYIDDDGPLHIVFIADDAVTPSNLLSKNVIGIDIV
jgi:hypothetical protein